MQAQNDRLICAGYGSLALDLLEQNPYLDAIVVPASGGALLTATALAIKHVNPRIKVYGVESSVAPLLHTALTNPKPHYITPMSCGEYVAPPPLPAPASASATQAGAEVEAGAGGDSPQLPYEILRRNVDGVLFVTETERASAILALMELEKTVVQGSGVAALGPYRYVCVVCCCGLFVVCCAVY